MVLRPFQVTMVSRGETGFYNYDCNQSQGAGAADETAFAAMVIRATALSSLDGVTM